jgi:hypothetical protein
VHTRPADPKNLDVERDLDTLSFSLTDWSAVMGRALIGVCVFLGFGVAGALATGGAEVLPQIPMVAGLVLPFTLFVGYALRDRYRIRVRIDTFGASITGRHREERVLWSEHERVMRRGRRIFLSGPRGGVELPTPTAYTDAVWMERLVREGVDSVGTEDGELPEDLRALRGVEVERG